MLSIQSVVRIALSLLLAIACQQVQAITIGTYNLPPFSMNEDGEQIGMITEVIKTLLEKANIKNNKTLEYPLMRGLAELRDGRVDIFYPYVLTDKHDPEEFILIGPVAKYSLALFVPNAYNEQISLGAMQHLIIGAERGSIEEILIRKHATYIDQATGGVSCLRMVLAERVNACAIGTLPGQYVAALNNLSLKLRYEETGDYADIYVALRTKLPKDIVDKIQTAYSLLKRENYFEQQQKAYEKRFAIFLKTLS